MSLIVLGKDILMVEFKKDFLIVLSILTAFALFAGCGENGHQVGMERKNPIEITKNNEGFIVRANHFVSDEMQQYQHNEELYVDYRSKDRYQTAYNSLKTRSDYSVELAQDILSGKYGFMCQYDRSKGLDTVWSSVYDLKNNKIYRAEGNPSRVKYKKDNRLLFHC